MVTRTYWVVRDTHHVMCSNKEKKPSLLLLSFFFSFFFFSFFLVGYQVGFDPQFQRKIHTATWARTHIDVKSWPSRTIRISTTKKERHHNSVVIVVVVCVFQFLLYVRERPKEREDVGYYIIIVVVVVVCVEQNDGTVWKVSKTTTRGVGS